MYYTYSNMCKNNVLLGNLEKWFKVYCNAHSITLLVKTKYTLYIQIIELASTAY